MLGCQLFDQQMECVEPLSAWLELFPARTTGQVQGALFLREGLDLLPTSVH